MFETLYVGVEIDMRVAVDVFYRIKEVIENGSTLAYSECCRGIIPTELLFHNNVMSRWQAWCSSITCS